MATFANGSYSCEFRPIFESFLHSFLFVVTQILHHIVHTASGAASAASLSESHSYISICVSFCDKAYWYWLLWVCFGSLFGDFLLLVVLGLKGGNLIFFSSEGKNFSKRKKSEKKEKKEEKRENRNYYIITASIDAKS